MDDKWFRVLALEPRFQISKSLHTFTSFQRSGNACGYGKEVLLAARIQPLRQGEVRLIGMKA